MIGVVRYMAWGGPVIEALPTGDRFVSNETANLRGIRLAKRLSLKFNNMGVVFIASFGRMCMIKSGMITKVFLKPYVANDVRKERG